MKKRKKITLEEEEIVGSDKQLTLSKIEIKRKYCVDVAMFSKQKFIGDLTPIPSVLIDYLNSSELKVFSRILGQLKNHSTCIIRRNSLANDLGVSAVTITTVLNSLEKMGIITQENDGRRKSKNINFATIQVLNDVLEDKLPGAAHAYRKAMGDRNINCPTEYAKKLLEIKYTPKEGVEAEEYD